MIKLIILISVSLISFLFGMITHKIAHKKALIREEIQNEKDREIVFKLVYESIKSGNSIFNNRLSDVVYIRTTTTKTGIIDLIYEMSKRQILLVKDNTIIYTSDLIDTSITNDIIEVIHMFHNNEINNVVNFFGYLFHRTQLEYKTNLKIDELNNIINNISIGEKSDVDIIIQENEKMLDIDEILDKISKYGIDSLTKDEKNYLDNYSK